ncbi:MAG: ribosomal protein L7/L12 [Clostridiales Family XIII bacterium]|jgi:ribosomal protein L7/L12|nr:ribosomal protein L7/L12 [Clostridiales Family XIII bacterium]
MVSREVQELINEGKTIQAVKLVREQTGLGLKESKELVDATPKAWISDSILGSEIEMDAAGGVRVNPKEPVTNPHQQMDDLMFRRKLQKLIDEGNRAGAIGLAFRYKDINLREAKEMVDAFSAQTVDENAKKSDVQITSVDSEEVNQKKLFGGSKLIRRRITLIRYTDEDGEHEISRADGASWMKFNIDHRKQIESHVQSDVPLIY